MYQLNKFCNIIFELRKERGWTQTLLADKIGISPQSVSKWECGIGYPDVTLFPIIADLFDVPIGVLFGEFQEEKDMKMDLNHKREFVFEPLKNIQIKVGNPCQIEVIDGKCEQSLLKVQGDSTFIEFFSIEIEGRNLQINIKNPTGSDVCWFPYDKGNYSDVNKILLYTGTVNSDCTVTNYLDLSLEESSGTNNSTIWICKKVDEIGSLVP